jgi:hypothetical protein
MYQRGLANKLVRISDITASNGEEFNVFSLPAFADEGFN